MWLFEHAIPDQPPLADREPRLAPDGETVPKNISACLFFPIRAYLRTSKCK
ncbi:hypothetical protein LHK_00473 [Laribacter hongkongensis HLHK9]|uniref:Uncharacterized protein n=1 Tax=Laribacter hongkongensis (strain HLHK9) TaxID=557598 RepID=C1DC51_LARHH|nr:hypothetical protein LHK_00473 [Laribacter hongkongensis HLHK9]